MTTDSWRPSHRVNSVSISRPGKRGEEFVHTLLSLPEEKRNRYQRFVLSRITEGDCIGCSPRGIAMTLNGYEVSVIYEASGFAAPEEYCDCSRGAKYRENVKQRRTAYQKQRVLEFKQLALHLFGANCLVPSVTSGRLLHDWPIEFPKADDIPEEEYQKLVEKRALIVTWVRQYLEYFLIESPDGLKSGFLLRGGPGTGKTGLVRSVIPLISDQGYCMLPLYAPEFFAYLQYCGFDERMRMIEMAKNVDVLFLDYLGDPESDELAPDYIRSALLRILDHRLDKDKRTIVTTELEQDMLWTQFGDHIFSTLGGLCAFIVVPGNDLR